MTWEQIQNYINTLTKEERTKNHATAYNALDNKYYLIDDPVNDKTIINEACLFVVEL